MHLIRADRIPLLIREYVFTFETHTPIRRNKPIQLNLDTQSNNNKAYKNETINMWLVYSV